MLPNFLVVGAAKAGTTSIHHYLQQHPEVYVPENKESHFFAGITPSTLRGPGAYGKGAVTTLEEYKRRFEGVTDERAIGEVCVSYLYYPSAARRIKSTIPNARIIIILRNPIDRAFSNYLHHVRDSVEDLTFEEAIEKENERAENQWWWGYQYVKASFYYEQVNRYLLLFGKDRVKIYLFEDLKSDAVALMQDIYRFIGVDDTFVPQIKRYNVSGVPKSKLLHNFLRKPSIVKSAVKHLIPERARRNLALEIQNRNLKKPEMLPETRRQLIEVFREDVYRLEKLIGRDLSAWYT